MILTAEPLEQLVTLCYAGNRDCRLYVASDVLQNGRRQHDYGMSVGNVVDSDSRRAVCSCGVFHYVSYS